MSVRTVEIGDAWKARRDAGLPCWCGEPINHVGWPVCGDTALGRQTTRSTAVERCPSSLYLDHREYACSFPAGHRHDECMALVQSDDGRDVALRWAKR